MSRPDGPRRPPVLLPALLAALLTAGVAAVVLGTRAYPLLGLADPGVLVRVAVGLLRVVADVAGAACLGALVLGLVLDETCVAGARRAATAAAAAWSVAALAVAVVSVADLSGGSLAAGGNVVIGLLAREVPLGWLASAVLAAGVAVWLREARTWSSTAGAGTLAAVALLGPVVTGHAVDGVGHDLGLPATAAHVVAATLWLGTLGAALVRGGTRMWRRAVRIDAACAVVVVGSGLVQAFVLVPSASGWGSAYGVLVLLAAGVTVVALAARALGTRVLGARAGGARTAVVEVVLLGVGLGLSVALTRAVPPVQAPGIASAPEAVLGYGVADPPGLRTLLLDWRIDVIYTGLAVVLAGAYALGLRRVPGWPRGRSAAWFAGCAVLVIATSSGLGRYGPALLSVHVAGHMLLATVVPVLLVLGGPLTLARRALPDAAAGDPDAPDGPREWLEHLVDAPALRFVTHPLVVTVAVVGSPFVLYLTPLFALTQPVGWLQPLITAWFLGAGLAFAWILVGVDPAPRALPWVGRLAVLLASMPFHALFGVVLLAADRPISRTPETLATGTGGGQIFVDDFYQRLRLPWAPDLLADQHLAAALTWAMGDLPLVATIVVLLVQWQRAGTAEDRSTREGLLAALRS